MTAIASRPPVGLMLRDWRQRRRLSQFDLALQAGISSRHLSFVETGRARPSAEMVLHIAQELDAPSGIATTCCLPPAMRRSSNSASSRRRRWDLCETRSIRSCEDTSPIPHSSSTATGAVAANRALAPLVNGVAEHLFAPPVNILRLSLHPEGLAPRILNLYQWRAHLLERLARDALTSADPALAVLHDELATYPDGGPGERLDPAFGDIAVPLRLRHGETELAFISTKTTFGTAVDVTVAELSIESFFPADPRTSKAMHSLSFRTAEVRTGESMTAGS